MASYSNLFDISYEYYKKEILRKEEQAIRRHKKELDKEELAKLQSYPNHKRMSYDQPDPLLLLCRT